MLTEKSCPLAARLILKLMIFRVPVTYLPKKIDRKGTDICPMEKTVADIDDTEEGHKALKAGIEELRRL